MTSATSPCPGRAQRRPHRQVQAGPDRCCRPTSSARGPRGIQGSPSTTSTPTLASHKVESRRRRSSSRHRRGAADRHRAAQTDIDAEPTTPSVRRPSADEPTDANLPGTAIAETQKCLNGHLPLIIPTRAAPSRHATLFDEGGTVGPGGGIAAESGPEIINGRYLAIEPDLCPARHPCHVTHAARCASCAATASAGCAATTRAASSRRADHRQLQRRRRHRQPLRRDPGRAPGHARQSNRPSAGARG